MKKPDTILSKVEAFLARTGVTETRFGRDCLQDPNFMADLRGGRNCTERTIQKVLAFMKRHDARA